MRFGRTLAQTAFCLTTMSSLGAAWPTFVEEVHREVRLVVRQDDNDCMYPDPNIYHPPPWPQY
ncbi:hypothetical protein IMZ48_23175 [Candidatus Bathyarchaeota archaeon]|nr:hypothetical protein [Candidatus Bathyarchaeota archaeon]